MIMLTRISGSSFVLNSDLIERVDSTPDTVVSLVDGHKYVVLESPAEVIRAVRQHRAEIIALSHSLEELEAELTASHAAAEAAAAVPAATATLSTVTSIHREG